MRGRTGGSAWLRVGPAVAVVGLLTVAGLGYTVAQSLGLFAIVGEDRLTTDAYRSLLAGESAAGREFWPALGYSLWVSVASTVLAAAVALALVIVVDGLPRPVAGATLFGLTVNLVLPHLMWAVALLVLLSQSGLLSRVAAAVGLIDAPADFPVVVRDPFGIGVIVHYVSKEVPFLVLAMLPALRARGRALTAVAATLGAGVWYRLRWVTLPVVAPSLAGASLLVFAFAFGAFEVPALLGVSFPRALSVLVLDLFLNPDLSARAEAAAVAVVMTAVVAGVAAVIVAVRRGPLAAAGGER